MRHLWNFLVITHCLLVTLKVSLITLFELPFGGCSREKMNRRVRGWAQSLVDFIGVELEVEGLPELKEGGRYVLMCNHSSLYDIPISMVAFDAPIRMIAKSELFKVPVWGQAMLASGFMPIDRDDRRQAALDLEYAKTQMEQGTLVWVAPEGTRSREGQIAEFKPGGFKLAMDLGAQIIPMGIEGAFQIMPAGSLKIMRHQKVKVRIGQPIDTTGMGKDKRKPLMVELRKTIAELAGQPDPLEENA